MGDTSSMDGESSSLVTSITSILGIKSQTLRFRPHKSTQKPHVILRRVQVSRDSDSGASLGCSVYFSLFAQKRIEVKPGKEILLAIASSDERFKDQAMVLEGDTEESESEHEEDPGVCPRCHGRKEREESAPPLQVSMPPKMRRAWNRNLEDTSPAPDTGSATRVSVGVQAAPSFSTVSVQSQPRTSCASVQAQCSTTFAYVQTSLPSLPMHVSSQTQTLDAHVATEVQKKIQLSLNTDSVSEDARERSLSPMELDSQCSSAPDSPVFSPTGVPAMIAVLDSTTNTPTSISSSLDAVDMQISPIESSASPLTPLPQYMRLPSPIKQEDSDSIDLVKTDSLLGFRLSDDPICNAEKSGKSDNASVDLSEVPRTSSGVAIDGSRPQKSSVGVEESKPLKRVIPNPFVSAGFVSDFIGSERKRTPVNVHVSSTEPSTSQEGVTERQASTPRDAATGVIAGATKEKGSQVLNDASLCKSRLPSKPIPTEPRAARRKPPTVPRSMLALSTTNPPSENTSTATGSPPPDAKSLAYLAPGSASNPLGIRPCSGLPTPRQTPVSSNPTKKRVVLGSDWPLTKAMSVNVGSASKSSLPPSNGSRLLDIEGYASPSPPSSPPPPPPPPPGNPPPELSTPCSQMKDGDAQQAHSMGSKWKRICVQSPAQPERLAISKAPPAAEEERTPALKATAENKADGKKLLSRISPSVERTARKSSTPVEIPTKTTRLIDEPPSITPVKRKAAEGLDHFDKYYIFQLMPSNDRCFTYYAHEKKSFSHHAYPGSTARPPPPPAKARAIPRLHVFSRR
ncbi:uncharacterized protein EV420DRAFT_359122 [Desarmillaria tabescens]|uniref:Uncharacterized protein n=1 Tax=Armillaria tabescens TaxID=1929756 RepID=A0AA39N5B8_ARMTA|nr:uncharacterized protein EV420DRAFT_359122 [Desarmillaria tabescens]KAK0458492.1 hypothetical protein EV420DRAFT_359122 [Desarmillaria tabescens]